MGRRERNFPINGTEGEGLAKGTKKKWSKSVFPNHHGNIRKW